MSLCDLAMPYVRAITPCLPGEPITQLTREMVGARDGWRARWEFPSACRHAGLEPKPTGHELEGARGARKNATFARMRAYHVEAIPGVLRAS